MKFVGKVELINTPSIITSNLKMNFWNLITAEVSEILTEVVFCNILNLKYSRLKVPTFCEVTCCVKTKPEFFSIPLDSSISRDNALAPSRPQKTSLL